MSAEWTPSELTNGFNPTLETYPRVSLPDCHSLTLQEGSPVAQLQVSLGLSPEDTIGQSVSCVHLTLYGKRSLILHSLAKSRSGDEGKEEARYWHLGTGMSQQMALSSCRSLNNPQFYFTASYWVSEVHRARRSCRSE